MFSKTAKKSASEDSGKAVKPAAPSIVSSDLRIVGDLRSDGEVHIDGALDGDIESRVLMIGEGGSVKGAIVADSLRVHGSVTGTIKARSVHLSKTARVLGDILHEDLSIERGAFMEGNCKRFDAAKTSTGQPLNLVVNDRAPSKA